MSVDLSGLPFYRERLDASGSVLAWGVEDLEDFAAAHDDPFAGRVRAGLRPRVALQLEATSEPPVWVGLEPDELEAWAAGLARLWRRLGVREGDTVAFFDYGSNPLVLLASSIYVPGLRRGAVERLGAASVCNDGVASMTARFVAILDAVGPAVAVVRRDLLAPLADAIATGGNPGAGRLRSAAVVDVDGAPSAADAARLSATLGVPVRRCLRADAAYLIAADCASCGRFHLDPSLHDVAEEEGSIVASARFARACPAVRCRIGAGRLAGERCVAEPAAVTVEWG